jgi:uncharacterized protein YebE (UPF0316 family)
MDNAVFTDSTVFQWVILPLIIFLARMTDVSIGTVRIILISKGKKFYASFLGFFEILVWLVAIRQIFLNLTNPLCFLAYAGGFAMGNYVGMMIEEKIAIGFEMIRIITQQDGTELIKSLNAGGYGATGVRAKGSTGDVHVIFTIVKRREIPHVIKLVKRFNPRAFYSIEDVKTVREGIFPKRQRGFKPFDGK